MSAFTDIVIDWMSRKGPAEWHGVATAWNWDGGEEPLLWIVDQPACDRATALTIFWYGEGYNHLDHAEHARCGEIHRIVDRVLANWTRYPTGRFKFTLPYHAGQLHLPNYGLSPDALATIRPLMISIDGQERYPLYDGGGPIECQIRYLESIGEPVSDFQRKLLAEQDAMENLSATDAEIAARHQRELEESLSDLDDMITEVERIRRRTR
jgi:hypothetical protein